MLDFYILNFSAFSPGLHTQDDWRRWADNALAMGTDTGEVPDISFVPAMLRRRLSQNIKMALYVAHHASAEQKQGTKAVFASRFGEWQQTAKLLTNYFNEDMISPIGFGLSVHNAASGLNSLINENKSACVAVAAGDGTFSAALIEAVCSISGDERMLLVYSDEATPEIYAGVEKHPQLALGLLLSRQPVGDCVHIKADFVDSGGSDDVLAFIRFYLGAFDKVSMKNISLEKGL